MIRKLLYFLTIAAFVSCQHPSGGDHVVTWIGGEIVNPKTDYVIVFKDECAMDTIQLDRNNYFMFEGVDLKEGLYSFQHHEYQVFYIEPGDSIMLRVNTVDFDESLTYSGKGAEKNNFLIEMFLLNETENSLMPELYLLSPAEFEARMDSMKAVRLDIYNNFIAKHKPGKNFDEIALANINYDFYSKKEIYTSAISGKKLGNEEPFPEDFYDYRKEIDLGNANLRSYYPYYRFLNRYFDNLAYEQYGNGNYLERYSFAHGVHKMKIIDSLITDDLLKQNMLRTAAGRYLLNARVEKNMKAMLDLFMEMNQNKEHRREISDLAEATMNLTTGNHIPNVMLRTADNTVKDLHSIFNKPTVLFFWSSQSVKHYKNIHNRADELREAYPEYDFIGINTDINYAKWISIVRNARYNPTLEFQFDDIDDAEKKLVINWVNKAIIVDKNGMIIEGNTNLFNRYIEGQLRNEPNP